MALTDIKNFVQVSDRIATAGQPTEGHLHEVAKEGYRLVINLGLLDPRYALADEAGLAASLGLRYEHIPVDFKAPRRADFDRFAGVMEANGETRMFVHCAANYRVSTFVALYGEIRWGWTAAQADAHMRRVWEPDETWQRFMADVRKGDR